MPTSHAPSPIARRALRALLGTALIALGFGPPVAAARPARDQVVITPAVPCFGAAAWDEARPCRNPALALMVRPVPAEARRAPNAPCRELHESKLLRLCLFGTPAAQAAGAVALAGDSHASHWRPALESVAAENRWQGISLARSSCPLSKATRNIPEPDRTRCSRWNAQVIDWFWRHPEVSTLFAGQLSGGKGVVVRRGEDPLEARVRGYLRAWRALPSTVRHIVVIRDTPKALRNGRMATCISRAMDEQRPAGAACGVRRAPALDPDAAVLAAKRFGRRAQVLDMTDFFCRRGRCPPVIGGALVYKDANHLTRAYVSTLGPIVERRVAALMAGWG